MAEPEDVLAEGALYATKLVRELWARRADGTPQPPGLRELRRRLELFIAAVFPDAPDIGVAEAPALPSFLARVAHRRVAHRTPSVPIASLQGDQIRLPSRLDSLPEARVAGRYRLLALEQAARAHRGTRIAAPRRDTLVRDLYFLAEAAAIDAWLLRMLPRLTEEFREARRDAASTRPERGRMSEQDRAVERLVLALLAADPTGPPPPFVEAATAAHSCAWAVAHQQRVSALDGPYRGMAPVPLWGAIEDVSDTAPASTPTGAGDAAPAAGRSRILPRRPRTRDADSDEDDDTPGTWMVRADDVQEKAEDPAGLQRPADRDDQADPGDLADMLAELPEARLVRRPGPVSEILAGENPLARVPGAAAAAGPGGLVYPEWDWRAAAYRSRACVLRARLAEDGEEAWVTRTLRRHASMIRAVRRDFELLRPRRIALRRQPDGAELDVDALVAAHADRRAGSTADDRFYIDVRPMQRDTAIALLVDVSASTDGWVTGQQRIIDVEKEALLVVVEALAALGDPHAVLAFSSEGPSRVVVRVLKRFGEPTGMAAVRRRIAGLEADGYTRTGAALRHATASLVQQPVRHRLLLLLSDGRPNDVDEYEGRYGIEDTRMAVAEARMQGVHVSCLTVDRQAPTYATRIFGRHFTVLSRPTQLPSVLTSLLRGLVRR